MIKNIKNLLTFCFVFILFSSTIVTYCNRANNTTSAEIAKEDICNDLELRSNLVQEVLDIPDIQQYYYKEEIEKDGLFLEQSSLVKGGLTLMKYEKPVNIFDPSALTEKEIDHHIRILYATASDSIHFDPGNKPRSITSLEKLSDTVYIKLIYESQGMRCFAAYRRNGCNWQSLYINTFEI